MIKKKVLISGRFNILHPGHLRLFRFAKECASYLIVLVESDRMAGSAAHIHENLRLEGVLSNSYVDEAFIINSPVVEFINKIRPDIVVKGKEHESEVNSEASALAAYGGSLIFSSGETIFSSLDLIRHEFLKIENRSINEPKDFMLRHNINKQRLVQLCHSFSQLRIVVVGDLIIDEYITCQPIGMSQEDPTIVVSPIDSVSFVGGAGIVAAHAAGLGAQVDFISVTGNDASRNIGIEKLEKYNVQSHLLIDISRPTTLKQRFRSNGKSLLRVSHLHQAAISIELQEKMLKILEYIVKKTDLLVFSDFNYGCLPQQLVEQMTKLAKKNGVLTAADSQSSSQVGDISRFRGMDLITPTEREARIAIRNYEDGLVVLGEKLRKQAKAKYLFLKLAEEGLLIHGSDGEKNELITDQIPALNTNPKDVSGAGDCMLIAIGMSIKCGASIWEAGFLGSLAAALQVGRLGNIPIKVEEILSEIK